MSRLEEKKAYKLRMAATHAKTAYAKEILKPDTITAAAVKAAADGFDLVRVRIERPLDLRQTEAAKKLAEVLEREGLRLDWEPRGVFGKDNPSGCDLTAFDVVVRW